MGTFCDVNPNYVPTDPGSPGLTTVASASSSASASDLCAGVVCAELPAGACELLGNCCALDYDAATGTSDCRELGCPDARDLNDCTAAGCEWHGELCVSPSPPARASPDLDASGTGDRICSVWMD